MLVVGGAGSLFASEGVRLKDSPDFPADYLPEATAFTTVVREIPNRLAIAACGTSSAASLLISAQSSIVITLPMVSGCPLFTGETVQLSSGVDRARTPVLRRTRAAAGFDATDASIHPILGSSRTPNAELHGARHCASASMLRARVPVSTVSRILGHSKPSITLDIFTHDIPAHAEVRDIT